MPYISHVSWKRKTPTFDVKTYDRTHTVRFGGGFPFEASSAPEFSGNANLPNPEELFIAAISSCFMLTFLYLAATNKLIVDEYTAEASGLLGKNSEGKMAITEVFIRPKIAFHENKNPELAVLDQLLKKAHEACFISSSVKTNIKVEPALTTIS